jgi:hypothetical protein
MPNISLKQSAFEVITPAEAKELLEENRVNRKLRPGVVEAYRRDMEEGRWGDTGEPIQISRTGGLMNGQHRMTALAGSSCEGVEFLVVRGLDDAAQTMMDQGAQRGVADALKISQGHIKNASRSGVPGPLDGGPPRSWSAQHAEQLEAEGLCG